MSGIRIFLALCGKVLGSVFRGSDVKAPADKDRLLNFDL
jgi:hypothetical protein